MLVSTPKYTENKYDNFSQFKNNVESFRLYTYISLEIRRTHGPGRSWINVISSQNFEGLRKQKQIEAKHIKTLNPIENEETSGNMNIKRKYGITCIKQPCLLHVYKSY